MTQSNRRISLLGTVLILACALSCSTACITSAIIDNAAAQSRRHAIADADAALEKTRLAESGEIAIPTITADPDSIERALRPALPIQRAEMHKAPYRNVVVVLQPPTYRITAYGEFDPAYAAAFTRFVNKLRNQIPRNCWFIVETYTGTPDARTKVDNFSGY